MQTDVPPSSRAGAVELGPADPVEVAAAPVPVEFERSWLTTVLPALSVLGMVGFALFAANPVLIALSGGLAVLSIGGALLAVRLQRRRAERTWAARCARYRSHLAACARQLDEAAQRQLAYDAEQRAGPRRPTDFQIVAARLGSGRAPARRPPRAAPGGAESAGADALAAAAEEVVGRYGAVDQLTVRLELPPGSRTVLHGPLTDVLRALVADLTATRGASDLALHAIAPAAELAWLSALPHCRSAVERDPAALLQGLRHDTSGASRLVVLIGHGHGTETAAAHVWGALAGDDAAPAVLALLPAERELPPDATTVIRPAPEGVPGVLLEPAGPELRTRLVPRVERLSLPGAACLAEAAAAGAVRPDRFAPPPTTLAELLGSTSGTGELRLPLGLADAGPLVLDLAEAADGGDGPHGLVIGSTGSGKSELLRTLVVTAATLSDPEQLSILLIDYKGGAAFGDLTGLPHLAGLATNLSDDPLAADRLAAALRAESRRRQQVLRTAQAPDLAAYRRLRDARPSLPVLPRLLVVIDEYAELVEQSPEALDALTSLGRVGRSLGIHLVLSSQRLDDGKLRGLDAHLRYRICLRTLNAGDSQSMLGSRAALDLPAEPGWAWLNRDGALTRWRVLRTHADDLRAAGAWPQPAAPVHQVLSPGLPERLCLDAVGTAGSGPAAVAVGLVDRPEHGRSEALVADLRRPLAVVGAPGSGRSTTLATLVAAFVDTARPGALAVHVIAAAGPLATVGVVPHVGTVASEPGLAGVVVTALAELTRSRRAGAPADSAVLLVVDDAGRLLRERDDLLPDLLTIATAGPAQGVHLALSAGRWSELRGGLREACATRWELPSPDVADSEHPQLVRRAGPRPPGRLLTSTGHWAQVALPHRCGCSGGDCPADGSSDELLTAVAARGGPPTPPMQPLPRIAVAAHLPPRRAGAVWVGVAGPYLSPVGVPLVGGDHLIVLGNSGSGRTGALRALLEQLTHRQLRIIDPRRTWGSPPGGAADVAVANSPAEITGMLSDLVDAVTASRQAGSSAVSAGPVLLIDDLDLASTRETSAAFTALADQLAHATDDGLSVVVARRASGSVRAGFEAFYGRLLEVCESAVILSGDPSEGPVIGGVRPEPRPPGRARLVRRGEPADLMQAAWAAPLLPDRDHGATGRYAKPDK